MLKLRKFCEFERQPQLLKYQEPNFIEEQKHNSPHKSILPHKHVKQSYTKNQTLFTKVTNSILQSQ